MRFDRPLNSYKRVIIPGIANGESLACTPKRRSRLYWLLGSIILFVAACPLETLRLSEAGALQGWQILVLGWLGFVSLQFGWYANLFLVGAWVSLATAEYEEAAIMSIGACFLGLQTFLLYWIGVPGNDMDLGPRCYLQSLGPGFYVWMASILSTIVGTVIGIRPNRSKFPSEKLALMH
jgi:hypothetical protein